MIPPTSAFYGEHSPSAGSSTPSPLCGVHLFGGNKDFVDACIWDDSLVTTAVLERSTLASPPWLIPRFFLVYETIFVYQTHQIEVSGSRRTELTRSCQGPPLKSEWQKVGSNSGPTAPEARTLPMLHASLPRDWEVFAMKECDQIYRCS